MIIKMKLDVYFLEKDIQETLKKIKDSEKTISFFQDLPKFAKDADQLQKIIQEVKKRAEDNIIRCKGIKNRIVGLK